MNTKNSEIEKQRFYWWCKKRILSRESKTFNSDTTEPSNEIMVLFVFRKLILQTRIRCQTVGLDVCFHTLCVRTAKALARLRACAGSPEPSLVAYVISTIISWAGSLIYLIKFVVRKIYEWFRRFILNYYDLDVSFSGKHDFPSNQCKHY